MATPNLMPTDAVRARHPLAHELTGIGGQIGCLQAMTRFGHRNQPYRAVRVYDRSGHTPAEAQKSEPQRKQTPNPVDADDRTLAISGPFGRN